MPKCILWDGYIQPNGYGKTPDQRYAHRAAYEDEVGPIPEGMTIDHLCNVRHCVNVDHMELVTLKENLRRGRDRRTCCSKGHEYTEANTYWWHGYRSCRRCLADRAIRRYHERKART